MANVVRIPITPKNEHDILVHEQECCERRREQAAEREKAEQAAVRRGIWIGFRMAGALYLGALLIIYYAVVR